MLRPRRAEEGGCKWRSTRVGPQAVEMPLFCSVSNFLQFVLHKLGKKPTSLFDIHPSRLALARNSTRRRMHAQMPAQMQHPPWRQSSEIRPDGGFIWASRRGPFRDLAALLDRGPPNALPRRKLPCIQARTNRARRGFNRSQRSGLRRRSSGGREEGRGGLRAPSCHPRSSARGAVG